MPVFLPRKSHGQRSLVGYAPCGLGARHDWACINSRVSQSVSSVAQVCPTLWDPMDRSTPGLPVHHKLLEFTQTHARRVGDAIRPCQNLPVMCLGPRCLFAHPKCAPLAVPPQSALRWHVAMLLLALNARNLQARTCVPSRCFQRLPWSAPTLQSYLRSRGFPLYP